MSIYGHGSHCDDAGTAVLQKPIITVWAEERGPLRSGEYEWSFGNNANKCYSGYAMSSSGTIFRMSLSSVKTAGKPAGEVSVSLVLNGEEQNASITKPAGSRSAFPFLKNLNKVQAGSVINFITKTGGGSSSASVVALLIELDL